MQELNEASGFVNKKLTATTVESKKASFSMESLVNWYNNLSSAFYEVR